MKKYTIKDLNKELADDDACLEYMVNLLYPDGIFCKACDKVTKHYRVTGRKLYACRCGAQVAPLAGTIFHKSPTPLRTWTYAIYLMANSRCGISAAHLQRETGVTYKTAWRMFKQIRTLLQEDVTLSGTVEAD